MLLCFHHTYIALTANAIDDTPSYICSSLNGNGLYPKLINVWLISNISNTTNLTIPAVLLFFGFAIVFTPLEKELCQTKCSSTQCGHCTNQRNNYFCLVFPFAFFCFFDAT